MACHKILHEDLGKRKLNARIMQVQKEGCSASCTNIWETASKEDTFYSSIITGDEKWCLQYDPQTKTQSAEWRGTSLTASKTASKIKTKLTVFFDCRGKEFVSEGQTANQDVYRGVLQHSILSP
jgi:hypothetical protein